MNKRCYSGYVWILISTLIFTGWSGISVLQAQERDSLPVVLQKITVSQAKPSANFQSSIPTQTLAGNVIQLLNTSSVGDAARYFSGVLVKDYGGEGGLKTVSVRSLGAANTGIVYDGIPVSDMQTGQVDLSRFSTLFLYSLSVYQANPVNLLSPARLFASGSVLEIQTETFLPDNFRERKWQIGMKAGSFGYIQPAAGILTAVGKNTILSAEAEALFSKGDYPYRIKNGNLTEKGKRQNAKTRSVQGGVNLVKLFRDSSTWQLKLGGYSSGRGLPGAVIFFNEHAAQELRNNNILIQSRYKRAVNRKTGLLFSAKYARNYTRYSDPDFQNGRGGIDDRYHEEEYYASASASHQIAEKWMTALATDVSYTDLGTNKSLTINPSRLGVWNSFSIRYSDTRWQVNGIFLNTYSHDFMQANRSNNVEKDRITPTLSASFKPAAVSPFLFRVFYKKIFRMPAFNDLYYNISGNRNLKPESSDQYNLGVTWSERLPKKMNHLSISADGYFNQVNDKIIAVPNQNLFSWSMMNLGSVHITGVDVNAEAGFLMSDAVTLFARMAYTFQHALDVTNVASATYKNRIPYTPDHSGSGLLLTNYRRWTFGYNFLFSGSRFALGANDPSNKLSGWATHDLSASYSVPISGMKMNVKVEMDNITNAHYDVVRYYPMPGSSYKISILFKNP